MILILYTKVEKAQMVPALIASHDSFTSKRLSMCIFGADQYHILTH